MTWFILIERPPGYFDRTGEVFEGTQAEVEAYVESLRASTGTCHAAELVA